MCRFFELWILGVGNTVMALTKIAKLSGNIVERRTSTGFKYCCIGWSGVRQWAEFHVRLVRYLQRV